MCPEYQIVSYAANCCKIQKQRTAKTIFFFLPLHAQIKKSPIPADAKASIFSTFFPHCSRTTDSQGTDSKVDSARNQHPST